MNLNILVWMLLMHTHDFFQTEDTTTENITINMEGDSTLELASDTDHIDIYDDSDTTWIKKAVLDVAYYLRSHKFNDFDRRFYNNTPDPVVSNLFGSFPVPPLKYFHWNVFSQCKNDFVSCLRYLYETVLDAYLQRSVDTIYLLRLKNLTLDFTKVLKIEEECINFRNLDNIEAEPFEGVLDRFQWRATASYYMCHFTLQKISYLEHFDERCDNFAYCFQEDQRLSSNDFRTNDSIPFQCAMYSFCPDPCCSNQKVIESPDKCSSSDELSNPCHKLNNKACSLNFTLNTSFTSMIYNQWNVTCICQNNSFEWSSRYGMCIDYNECKRGNPCDLETEICLNSRGNFFCFCKFGYKWSNQSNKCISNEILTRALKRYSGLDLNSNCTIAHKGYKNITAFVIFYVLLSCFN